MSARWASAGAALGALVTVACSWDHLDVLTARGNAIDASRGDDALAPADASAQASPPDAALPSADALPSGDASGGAAPPPGACANGPAAMQWSFDANVDGWTLAIDTNVQAQLAWIGGVGYPAAGALRVDVAPRASDAGGLSGAWLRYEMGGTDLTGRTVSAWVWLESGASPHLKTFVQTGTQYAWADDGTVLLSPHVWTCVSLPVSAPSYNQPSYNPGNVVRIGFEVLGQSPFVLFVDTVRYY
jgi:hypothetical protein